MKKLFLTACLLVAGLTLSLYGQFSPVAETQAVTYIPITIAQAGGGGGCGNIVAASAAARVSGTAPLYVALDASGTTSVGITTKPFHDIEYTWGFGDTGAGSWAAGSGLGSNSKNVAYGPMAGHIFETPGTYSVTLSAYDGTSNCDATPITITVADPDSTYASTTVCVGNSAPTAGVGGCPSGAAVATSADFDAVLSAQVTAGKRRILFKRGDTFVASTGVTITATGPGTIGAYGSGAVPQVNVTGSQGDNPIIEFGNSSTVLQKDWRVMDLSFSLNNSAEAIGMGGGFDQVTILRVTARACGDACIFYNSAVLNVGANPHLFDQAAVVDCDLAEPESWGLFFNAKNFFIAGNTINSATGSHTLRISIGINGAISNNTLGPNGLGSAGTHVLKLHAAPYGSATDGVPINTATQKIVISYNSLQPGNNSTNNWTMAIDPQDDAENERIQDVIVEANTFLAGTNTGLSISLQAVDATIRNNVSNNTGGADGCFIEVNRRSTAAPAPTGIKLYNNSLYTNSNNLNGSDTPFIVIRSNVATGGITAKNNLGYAPGVSGTPLMFLDQGSGNTLANNSSNAQTKTNPNYTTNPPVTLGNYKPTSGYSLGAGASVPNFHDPFRVLWAPTWDIGAVKH